MTNPYILVVDDEPDIRLLVKEILEDEGFKVNCAEDAHSARAARRARKPDLVLLDVWMPGTDGISLLKEWKSQSHLDTPVVMMSGHGSIENAVEATKHGAYDFLEKPLSLAKLVLTVKRGIEASHLLNENTELKKHHSGLKEPLGNSLPMRMTCSQARKIAAHNTPLIIYGESGSGKGLLAQFIHDQSSRRGNSFVRVPGSSLRDVDSASELFGVENKQEVIFGSLEKSDGGTLFLEDIADMHKDVQTRLISVLKHGSFLRFGGVRPVPINVRIVGATSLKPEEVVTQGHISKDLFYQLGVLSLESPTLRCRPDDIPALITYFVEEIASQQDLTQRKFNAHAIERLQHYQWPGNVRELKNHVQRLLILGGEGDVTLEEVNLNLGQSGANSTQGLPQFDWHVPLRDARDEFEKSYLQHHIRAANGNISLVAKRVGMERTHLYRKLKRLGINTK